MKETKVAIAVAPMSLAEPLSNLLQKCVLVRARSTPRPETIHAGKDKPAFEEK
jgi:hypothetical protein